jgi:putative Mg2+ transporter-C (MgtC) family protein
MTWDQELLLIGRALLAAALGGLIGFERKSERIPGQQLYGAGVRTYAAVALGACMFGLISWNVPGVLGAGNADRIAANVVTGIGFLGAGLIIQDRHHVKGLTTAATLWATASVGLAVAYGLYILGSLTAGLIYLLLLAHRWSVWRKYVEPLDEPTPARHRNPESP